jgi:hypothetical protein
MCEPASLEFSMSDIERRLLARKHFEPETLPGWVSRWHKDDGITGLSPAEHLLQRLLDRRRCGEPIEAFPQRKPWRRRKPGTRAWRVE